MKKFTIIFWMLIILLPFASSAQERVKRTKFNVVWYEVYKPGKGYGIENENGKLVVPCQFISIEPDIQTKYFYPDNNSIDMILLGFQVKDRNNQVGYYDADGNLKIQPGFLYEHIERASLHNTQSGGRKLSVYSYVGYIVEKGGYVGYLDQNCISIIPMSRHYTDIELDNYGFHVYKGGKHNNSNFSIGYCDKKGKEIIPCRGNYELISRRSTNKGEVFYYITPKSFSGYGLCDTDGNEIVDPSSFYADFFRLDVGDFFVFWEKDNDGIYSVQNIAGIELARFPKGVRVSKLGYNEGKLWMLIIDNNGNFGLADCNGKIIVQPSSLKNKNAAGKYATIVFDERQNRFVYIEDHQGDHPKRTVLNYSLASFSNNNVSAGKIETIYNPDKPKINIPGRTNNTSSNSSSSSSSLNTSAQNGQNNSSQSGGTTTVVVEHHGVVQEWVPCGGCNGTGVCPTCAGTGRKVMIEGSCTPYKIRSITTQSHGLKSSDFFGA